MMTMLRRRIERGGVDWKGLSDIEMHNQSQKKSWYCRRQMKKSSRAVVLLVDRRKVTRRRQRPAVVREPSQAGEDDSTGE